jgi:hypothetical protein
MKENANYARLEYSKEALQFGQRNARINQTEQLDFASFLKQKKILEPSQIGNIAQRIHQRFRNLDGENLPIPARRLSRIPPDWIQCRISFQDDNKIKNRARPSMP